MNLPLPVVRARWSDIDRIADLVAGTLSPTAVGAWLVPDQRDRPTLLAAVARIWIEHALLFGEAFLLPDGAAATVWYHRYRPIPPPARYTDRLAHTCGANQDRFLQLDQALATRRPTEAHNHLALLAAPSRAGSDRAAAVLAGAQQWMDTLSLPTYAEAFTNADLDLFQQHGYTRRDSIPINGHTTTHSMWRPSPFWDEGPAETLAHACLVRSSCPATTRPPGGRCADRPGLAWPGVPLSPVGGPQNRPALRRCDILTRLADKTQ
ncbi:hypothetical protein ONA70_32145 [Micromonospora yasonensis]|uniref:hypothetical protein n=1 Tax=Micromonospora yasonensis TaxID=1128667 RepID=UPI00222F18ED|nr:hypothetical protein [Micromonospora yasonensis]MCW3844740.1 hypothetical protein [Micromonospora yasonensis]